MRERHARWVWLGALLLAGCAGGGEEKEEGISAGTCDASGPTQVHLIQTLRFSRRDDSGQTVGFDLDQRVSDRSDALGCYQADLIAPDGTQGIDSAFSGLMPALELTEAVAIEGLIQTAIRSGELLLTIEIEGIDDPDNDDCVNVSIGQALGPVLVGTDGEVAPGQTLERDPSVPVARLEGLAIRDGVLVGGVGAEEGMTLAIPVQILDQSIDFTLMDGAIYLAPADAPADDAPAGTAPLGQGYFGGGVPIAPVIELIENANTDLNTLIRGLLTGIADLAPDEAGACTRMSTVMEYTTVPAFYFD